MRTILTLLLGALVMNICAQRSVNGEGDVVSRDLNLASFTGVSLGFDGDVYLTQGSNQSVRIEAQQNLIDILKKEVKNGTWHIGFEKNVRNHKPIKVYITMPTLTKVGVSGSGNLESTGRFTGLGDIGLAVSGSGDVKLDMDADDVDGAISGSGTLRLKGNASSVSFAVSGSGDVYAEDLKAKNGEVAVSGSGNVKLHVTESLDAAVSGSGDVRYAGGAQKIRAKVSGSGDVEEMR